jgi:hypothetical protein
MQLSRANSAPALDANGSAVENGLMTIFSRRSIQQSIGALSAILTQKQLSDIVGRLNREDEQSLAAEWEAQVLSGLSTLGTLQHEVGHGGSTRPDIFFSAKDTRDEFVADITCVSDQGLEEQNPVTKLSIRLHLEAAKLGIPPGGFDIQHEHQENKVGKGYKVRLALPDESQLEAFFREHIAPQLKIIASNPGQPHKFLVSEPPARLAIAYQPGTPYSTGGYRAFRNVTSADKNPLYQSLELKRKKLKKSGYQGALGVIVCDGGCEVLQRRHAPDWSSLSRKQVIDGFFKQTATVSFVLLIWVEAKNPYGPHKGYQVAGELHVNPKARSPLPASMYRVLGQISQAWQTPVQNAENARLELSGIGYKKKEKFWGHHLRGWKMHEKMFRMSARVLLESLAVDGAAKHLDAEFDFARTGGSNPFLRALMAGRTISAVKIDHEPGLDDDYIEFRFSDPDPAISPFKVPTAKAGDPELEQRRSI